MSIHEGSGADTAFDSTAGDPDRLFARTIAARLVTLLPLRPERKTAGPRAPRQEQHFGMRARIVMHALPYLTLLALLLASQWAASRYQEVAHNSRVALAAATTISTGTRRSTAALQHVGPRSGSRPKVGE